MEPLMPAVLVIAAYHSSIAFWFLAETPWFRGIVVVFLALDFGGGGGGGCGSS